MEDSIKLWHDDIRKPPDDSWVWARTNEEAKKLLREVAETSTVLAVCSLDHDLGFHEADPDMPGAVYLAGQGEETGLHLVKWMIEAGVVTRTTKLQIHSMNSVGARRMQQEFESRGFYATLAPYQAPTK